MIGINVLVSAFLHIAICCGQLLEIKEPDSNISNLTDSNLNFNNTNITKNIDMVVKVDTDVNFDAVAEYTNNSINDTKRKDRHFGLDSIIFEDYLKSVDLSVIPGYQVDDDFENWVPPEEIRRELPEYLAGFDPKMQPIWVAEYGKYNYTKFATGGKKLQALFHKYFRYLAYIALKSHAIKRSAEHPVNRHVIIIDFEGLTPDHLLNRKALQLQLKWITDYRRYAKKYFDKIVAINVNHLSETLFNFMRPFVVAVVGSLEVYDTNKARWAPQLLKSFAKDQVPEWYGGSKGFKPLYVTG